MSSSSSLPKRPEEVKWEGIEKRHALIKTVHIRLQRLSGVISKSDILIDNLNVSKIAGGWVGGSISGSK